MSVRLDGGSHADYPGDRFPEALAAVVQRTVLNGAEPARLVIHDDEGDWLVGDGVHDPNEESACVLVHMAHVVDADPSIQQLVAMPSGKSAWRANSAQPWTIEDHLYPDDD